MASKLVITLVALLVAAVAAQNPSPTPAAQQNQKSTGQNEQLKHIGGWNTQQQQQPPAAAPSYSFLYPASSSSYNTNVGLPVYGVPAPSFMTSLTEALSNAASTAANYAWPATQGALVSAGVLAVVGLILYNFPSLDVMGVMKQFQATHVGRSLELDWLTKRVERAVETYQKMNKPAVAQQKKLK